MPERNSVLIIGGGGREAALAHAHSKSPQVDRIYVAPGNDLIKYTSEKSVQTLPNLRTDAVTITRFCRDHHFDLVDVPGEGLIAEDLVGSLRYQGTLAFGPVRDAARLEWDKAFAKDFMNQYRIPTARYGVFWNTETALKLLREDDNERWFIKASGLAGGKGAFSAANLTEAEAIMKFILPNLPNEAGDKFVVEQWLEGEEFSAFYLADGDNFIPAGLAQDHKLSQDNDQGDNTGGMGVVTRPSFVDSRLQERVRKEVVERVRTGLHDRGLDFCGVLYIGGIYNQERESLNVLEFNCRWGDPEAEALLPGFTNDYFELAMAVAESDRYTHPLKGIQIQQDGRVRVSVAAVSRGYPDELKVGAIKGKRIYGLDRVLDDPDVLVYGGGVKEEDGYFYANGGRLFHVVAEGDSASEARKKVYAAMSEVYIKGDKLGENLLDFRKDIGMKELQRKASN